MATATNDQAKMDYVIYELDEIKKSETGFAISVVESKENPPKANVKDDTKDPIGSDSESHNCQSENTFRGRIMLQDMPEMNDDLASDPECVAATTDDADFKPTEFKSIDEFSVMKKYLKKKCSRNKIIITVDEVDEKGNVVRRETRNATEFHL